MAAAGRRALSSNLHHLPDRQAETTPLQRLPGDGQIDGILVETG